MMACGGQPQPEAQPKSAPAPATESRTAERASRPAKDEVVGIQAGVQHPPIPADSPAWRRSGGFVPDPQFYGEHDWDGVRVHLAGHIGVIERDRARWLAGQGRLQQASEAYARLATDLASLSERLAGPARRIPDLIVAAAQRDAARLRALNAGATGGAAAPSASLKQRLPDISDFKDFDDRHEMRVELWSLYLEAADPVHPDTAWGYFDQASFAQLLSLREDVAASEMHRLGVSEQCPAAAIHGRRHRQDAHRNTLIDVGGEPGPKGHRPLGRNSASMSLRIVSGSRTPPTC